ncbi:DUF937 domain-containing protein [Rhizobium sp. C4]|uniref:DUF937 domain-containing protein n=1 Tax=Rhizobium sp. C4 TaxID=1349800 RepID=UPI001E34EAE1|nr:DUF937 domain-containing protein [Rhizobium sp. C4]MCD2172828.1 DUF937 domain-containing protein [Rhizobium sp. C4]
MLPLFDLMMQAQNGKALEAFSAQFGLAQEQMAKAMAALTPAFSTGLKRSAANPYDLSTLMSSLMSGNYGKYFEDVNAAFSPQGIADGQNFMGTIFGPVDVQKAIAEQAAKVTGVGQDMLRSMMPAMASAMAGGLIKEMTGQYKSMTDQWTASNPMMGAMTQWMEAAGFQPKPKKPDPIDNPFLQMMQMMMGGAANKPTPQQADPFGASAFVKMMQGFMTPPGGQTEAPKAEAKPETVETAKPVDLTKYSELVGSLFDSGLEVQKSYQKSMEQIFDGYLKGFNGNEPKT